MGSTETSSVGGGKSSRDAKILTDCSAESPHSCLLRTAIRQNLFTPRRISNFEERNHEIRERHEKRKNEMECRLHSLLRDAEFRRPFFRVFRVFRGSPVHLCVMERKRHHAKAQSRKEHHAVPSRVRCNTSLFLFFFASLRL